LGFEYRSRDTGAGQAIGETGVVHEAGVLRRALHARQKLRALDRVRAVEALLLEHRVGDAPAAVDLAHDVLDRHAPVAEKDFGQFPPARARSGRPARKACASSQRLEMRPSTDAGSNVFSIMGIAAPAG